MSKSGDFQTFTLDTTVHKWTNRHLGTMPVAAPFARFEFFYTCMLASGNDDASLGSSYQESTMGSPAVIAY